MSKTREDFLTEMNTFLEMGEANLWTAPEWRQVVMDSDPASNTSLWRGDAPPALS